MSPSVTGAPHRLRPAAAMLMLLAILALATGCLRVDANITISPDDLVSGQITAASQPRDADDDGPQFSSDLPFSQKVAISQYEKDGYVGSSAVFSDLTFAELPQLANMNSDAAGVDLSLRRAGDQVVLEGRADLSALTDDTAEVTLSVAFPGEVTSTDGDQVAPEVVEWTMQPGAVTSINAQARYTDPSARSFVGAATATAIGSLLVAVLIGALAWASRDRSPRIGQPSDASR